MMKGSVSSEGVRWRLRGEMVSCCGKDVSNLADGDAVLAFDEVEVVGCCSGWIVVMMSPR